MSVGIQDALAKLYLKLGGDPEKIKENKNVTDYVDDLADVFKLLIELPIVNKTDNGKILKVVNGKWNKAEESSSSYFLVKFSFNESTENWDADKTFSEIKNAYEKGNIILFAIADSCDVHIALYEDYGDSQSFICQIQEVTLSDQNVEIYTWFISYNSNNGLEVTPNDASIPLNS